MRAGDQVTGTHAPSAVVRVNGTDVPVESVRTVREIRSSLPAGVTAGDGFTPTLADAVLSRGLPSGHSEPSPWGPDVPKQGQGVTVDVGGQRIVTGRTDLVRGAVGDKSTLGVVDHADRLSRTVTIAPKQATMPPNFWEDGAPDDNPVPTALTREHDIASMLMAAGWHVSPPVDRGFTMLACAMHGSLEPQRDPGNLAARGMQWQGNNAMTWKTHPDGMGSGSNFTARWTTGRAIITTRDRQFHVQWRSTTRARFKFTHGPVVGDWELEFDNRAIRLYVGGATLFAGSIAGSTDSLIIRVSIRTAFIAIDIGGDRLQFPITTRNYSGRYGEWIDQTYADSRDVGWWHYAAGSSDLRDFQPTAFIETRGGTMKRVDATPGFENRKVSDVLADIARARAAAMWIDEDDRFHWVEAGARSAWTSPTQAPARIVSAADDLTGLGWESAPLSTAARVRVNWQRPDVSQSTRTGSQTGWQAPSVMLEPNQTVIWFATPESDREWVGITGKGQHEPPRWANLVIPFAATKEGDEHRGVPPDQMPFLVERVGTQTIKITLTSNAVPAVKLSNKGSTYDTEGRDAAYQDAFQNWQEGRTDYDRDFFDRLRSKPPGSGLFYNPPQFTRQNWPDYSSDWPDITTPLVPVWGITTWIEESTVVGNMDSTAPELVIDAGRWVTTSAEAMALANTLLPGAQSPEPTITDLRIIPDTRLQLGDRIRVTDEERSGIDLVGVVFGITDDVTDGRHDQSIALRVIPGSSQQRATWAQVEAAWGNRTWQQVEAANQRTWQAMEDNPLQGA